MIGGQSGFRTDVDDYGRGDGVVLIAPTSVSVLTIAEARELALSLLNDAARAERNASGGVRPSDPPKDS